MSISPSSARKLPMVYLVDDEDVIRDSLSLAAAFAPAFV